MGGKCAIEFIEVELDRLGKALESYSPELKRKEESVIDFAIRTLRKYHSKVYLNGKEHPYIESDNPIEVSLKKAIEAAVQERIPEWLEKIFRRNEELEKMWRGNE